MKIMFEFKGSIFNQKEKIILTVDKKTTILSSIKLVTEEKPHLKSLLLKDNLPRSDILIIVDGIDVIAMNLLEKELIEDQKITILPLAHGG